MARIEGLNGVLNALRRLDRLSKRQNTGYVVVGYTAAYALWVHEDVEMKWRGLPRDHTLWTTQTGSKLLSKNQITGKQHEMLLNVGPRKNKPKKALKQPRPKGYYWDPQGRGQAKFLEQPATDLQKEMGDIITQACIAGEKPIDALLKAGLFLQRESMKLCPVDTGYLKASAFTDIE